MTNSTFRPMRWVAAWAGVLLLCGTAAPVRGQEVRTDPRWQPWLGCWEAEEAGGKPEARTGSRSIVCVLPGEDAATVEIASLVDSRVVNRETVSATGTQRDVAREGCSGWERAAWSPGGERVYVRAEYACGGGVSRRSSGMMAMTPNGEWLDIQSVTVRDRSGLRVVRYRPAEPGVVLADEIALALQGPSGAGRTARLAAGSAIRPDDVVEACHEVDPTVVGAWLTERGQGFVLSGRRLVELTDAGVPGGVTDVMVALSFPREFQVNPSSREGEPRLVDGASGQAPLPRYGYAPYGGSGYYSPYGWDPYIDMYGPGRYGWYSPYGWNAYGYSPYGYGYSPWGYGYGNGYGYGGGYGYGSWYWGNQPIVIIDGSGSGVGGGAIAGGRVVNGRGYTRPGSNDASGARARPRETPTSSVGSGGGGGSGGGSSSARPASGGSSGSSSGSGSSGSSGSTGRVAHPRPPSD